MSKGTVIGHDGTVYNYVFSSASFSQIAKAYNDLMASKSACSAADLEKVMSAFTDVPPFVTDFVWAKFYNAVGDYKQAISYLDKCLTEIESNDSNTITFLMNNGGCDKTIYATAGEIYAYGGFPEKSLRSYQDYEVLLLRLSSCDYSQGLLSFRKFSEHSLADLINNEITVCSPRVMNDPYDTLLLKWGESIKKRKGDKAFCEPECQSFESYRIRSFCELKDDRGFDTVSNVLMWSHYADEHKGFCIKYKFSKDFQRTEARCTTRFKKIIYHDRSQPLDLMIDTMDTNKALCMKLDDWKYENEVRLITYYPDVEGKYLPIRLDEDSFIEEIYFGYLCPEETIKTVKNALQDKPDIKYYKMDSDYTNIYSLKATPLL